MTPESDPQELRARCESAGLVWRGAFHPRPEDGVPTLADGRAAATLVLLGLAGTDPWNLFATSPEARDGLADPLDRWSRRVVRSVTPPEALAVFPFDGPPWLPFQRWATRAEGLAASPLGLLIHPHWGLWHAYRGAIALPGRLDLPKTEPALHACLSCADAPCLKACPAGAVSDGPFDYARCAGHLATPAGASCHQGCLARAACPVGPEHRYGPEQSRFHMRARLADCGAKGTEEPTR